MNRRDLLLGAAAFAVASRLPPATLRMSAVEFIELNFGALQPWQRRLVEAHERGEVALSLPRNGKTRMRSLLVEAALRDGAFHNLSSITKPLTWGKP